MEEWKSACISSCSRGENLFSDGIFRKKIENYLLNLKFTALCVSGTVVSISVCFLYDIPHSPVISGLLSKSKL